MDKSKYLVLLLALAVGVTHAQTRVASPQAVTPTAQASPDTIMPPGKFYVNMDTAPKGKRGGSKTVNFGRTFIGDIGFVAGPNNNGSFRISCGLSHFSNDDPIVHPNRPGATHAHMFFGNTETGANTVGDMRFVGNSTCAGGTANKTGYWAPALVYHCPSTEVGCDRKRDGEIQPTEGMLFYYKAGGGFNTNSVVWFPPGLNMITGSASNTNPAAIPGRVDCYTSGAGGPSYNHIPTTAEATAIGCYSINLFIQFPICWDGVNLDAPDHISHVKYNGNGDPFYVGCAGIPGNTTHLQQFPEITLNIHFAINPADMDYLRLSSDQPKATATGLCATAQYNFCAGATMHSDWKNGWSTDPNFGGFGQGTIADMIMKDCYRKNGSPTGTRDCHANLFYVDPAGYSWTLN